MTKPWDIVMQIAKEQHMDDDEFMEGMDILSKIDLPDIPAPRMVDQMENDGVFTFTMVDCDVSFVNTLRRILLTNVPVCCIRTENEDVNQCTIFVNTTRLHNEFLKHRLSCIPIHTTDLAWLPGKYELMLDISNDTDHVLLVTSQHFKIRHKLTHEFLSEQDTLSLFPPCPITGDFIEFARLRPRIGDIPSEHLSLVADFSVATPKDNAMFNSLSKCTYSATIDHHAAQHALQQTLHNIPPHEHAFTTHNFHALDAQRFTIPRSWLFSIQSIGIYTNQQLFRFATNHLHQLFLQNSQHILTLPHSPHSHSITDTPFLYPFDLSFLQFFSHFLHTLFVPTHIHFIASLQPHPLYHHFILRSSTHTHLHFYLAFASLYASHLIKGTYGSP